MPVFSVHQFKIDVENSVPVQQRPATKMEERLRQLGFFSLEKRWVRGDLLAASAELSLQERVSIIESMVGQPETIGIN